MIFSTIKGITIPEGAVKQIADSAGHILWKGGGVDVAGMVIGYTGAFTDQKDITMSGKVYRLLTLTGSGTLTLPEKVTADVWLCSGGNSGGSAGSAANTAQGGGGGYFLQQDGVSVGKNTVCTIGAGAGQQEDYNSAGKLGGASSFGALASKVGTVARNGASGGGGAVSDSSTYQGLGDGKTTVPFGESSLFDPHSAGGGGGGYRDREADEDQRTGGGGGSNGSNGGEITHDGISGGNGGEKGGGGGGAGASATSRNGEAATFYGSGGGGGGYYCSASGSESRGSGGAGYQGVIYVRIPYEQ